MALYAYGVQRAAEAKRPAEDVVGLGGGALEHVTAGDLSVLVSPVGDGEIRRTRRNMLTHLRLLEGAMRAGPVLPMRFGVVAESPDALRRVIASRAADLAALLDRHEGHAEYGVRISCPRRAAMMALAAARPDLATRHKALAARGPGARDALITLGQQVADALEARRKTAERALMDRLKPLATDFVLGAPEDDVQVLHAEFLLRTDAVPAFEAEVAAAAATVDFAGDEPPAIRLVGPAPPYNFVSIHLDPDADAVAA